MLWTLSACTGSKIVPPTLFLGHVQWEIEATAWKIRQITFEIILKLDLRKVKLTVEVKVGFLYSATYMVDQEQRALTISEVAVDRQGQAQEGSSPF